MKPFGLSPIFPSNGRDNITSSEGRGQVGGVGGDGDGRGCCEGKRQGVGVVWNPHLKKHIEKIEKVQRTAKRWVLTLRDLSYEERLKKLQLSPLTERRERGNMIMLYKCVEGIEKIHINEYVIPSKPSLRGHRKCFTRKGSRKMVKVQFP